ncbi:hypothetical protein [Pseudomonas syringae]|uniref:hypothetical protein n=1 Tax=Pseudomonas syringae TaxID=317 RepID=UPI001EE776D1|nr:hypothetical protein [Pseudomonas syringae]
MKLIQCRFSSGQRVPLLVQAGDTAPLPMLVPFIYVQLKLRYRAYNTAAAHLRASTPMPKLEAWMGLSGACGDLCLFLAHHLDDPYQALIQFMPLFLSSEPL